MIPKDPGHVSISPIAPEAGSVQNEQMELRLEKVGNRVTMLAIMIPVLLIVVAAIAYLDIKRRVISAEDTGTTGVQSLSQNLESRFSSLSVKLAELEQAQAANSENQAKELKTFKKRLYETEKSQVWLKKITATKKQLDSQLSESAASIRTDMAVIQKDVVTADENVTALNASMKKELADIVSLIERYDTQLLSLQADLTTVSADKADQTQLTQEVSKARNDLRTELKQARTALESLIRINQDRIAKLAKTPVKAKAPAKKAPTIARPAPKPAVKAPTPKPKPAPKPRPTAPSAIIEKNIE